MKTDLLLSHPNSCRHTHTNIHKQKNKKSVFWVCRWRQPGDSAAVQRASSAILCEFIHCKQVWGWGWEGVQAGNQPKASTGKCRPLSGRFMFASPATFASNNNLLLIIFYCKNQSAKLSFTSGWQGGQRTGETEQKKTESHNEDCTYSSETELEETEGPLCPPTN